MRQYELRCKTWFERGVAQLDKQAQDRIKGAGKRVAGRMDRGRKEWRPTVTGTAATLRVPETRAELRAWRGARTKSGGWRWTGAGGGGDLRSRGGGGVGDPPRTEGRGDGGDPPGARDPRRTSVVVASGRAMGTLAELAQEEWERMEQELDASDIRACGGFLPLGRTGLASG